MKLIHHCEEPNTSGIVIEQDYVERELKCTTEELRIVEEKFFKIFDLNPCPMAIADANTNVILDVNEAFVKIIELDNKYQVIGHDTSDLNHGIIDKEVKNKMYGVIKEGVLFKNVTIPFKSIKGKKLRGLFSGSVIELNGKKCIFTMCQVINRKCLGDILKTYFVF